MIPSQPRRWTAWALWAPGLCVGCGAAVATAHGLYEVAAASRVPPGIAWLYPVITDGLALVAYVSTARLTGSGRRYAWTVVVLAAGLSGLAQASYLAGNLALAPPALRFGVGAWPAIAAAIVAHLLFLLGTHRHAARSAELAVTPAVQPPGVQPSVPSGVQPAPVRHAVRSNAVQPADSYGGSVLSVQRDQAPAASPSRPAGRSPARERARSAARRHATLHGSLPTVSQLQALADVGRGTAGTALKELREQPTHLHVVNDADKETTTT